MFNPFGTAYLLDPKMFPSLIGIDKYWRNAYQRIVRTTIRGRNGTILKKISRGLEQTDQLMKRRTFVRPEAQTDIREAAQWYEDGEPRLGYRIPTRDSRFARTHRPSYALCTLTIIGFERIRGTKFGSSSLIGRGVEVP